MSKPVAAGLITTFLAGLALSQATAQTVSGASKPTATPVKHLVVIFDENISFDHYFGTYPNALNRPQESAFKALPGTPSVNGLVPVLLQRNPNFLNVKVNGDYAVNPIRLGPKQAFTADQSHDYTDEQHAFHAGLMDSFPKYTGLPAPPTQKFPAGSKVDAPPEYVHQNKGLVMSYFDGNTVTALWNYAQRFALNDNSFASTFGQSTQGAIELISGQTNGVTDQINAAADLVDGGNGTYTEVDDGDPIGDKCSNTSWGQLRYTGNNIGQMLSKQGVSWGWFEAGFDLTKTNPNGTVGCLRSTYSKITQISPVDYIPHHEPFQYYTPTANLLHTRPSSVRMIGQEGDAANHQYDTDDFFAAVKAGNFPAVSFLKPPAYQDAHAAYSDPLDEQTWLVTFINFLERRPEWKNTAIIVAYDDSDGWYDHQMGPIMNQSTSKADGLTGPGECGDGATALGGPAVAHAQGRCGYGPRLPLLVISPFARRNFVDHSLTDQTSVLRFIEDNWLHGERVGSGSFDAIAGSINAMFDFSRPDARPLILDKSTGQVLQPRPKQ
ncbi:MAG: alkaline phosphatase family protein [Acidobacteriaceae bacterium]